MNPLFILSSSDSTTITGTTSTRDYQTLLDYLWENNPDSYSVYRKYEFVKNFELRNNISSRELIVKWKSGELKSRSMEINNWLSTYLKISNFVK